jgi:hypothetical protein
MKTPLKFYIGERSNPQFKKSYYVTYGQLTKKDAQKKEKCLYGSIFLTSYESEEDYNNAISKLKAEGFNVN